MQTLGMVSLLVREYDEAITYFTQALRFRLVEDTALAPNKRWVVVSPSPEGSSAGAHLLLAKASTPEQLAQVGKQNGGRVCLFLYTSDFTNYTAHLAQQGVHFAEPPRQEAYGRVVVFHDLYGNKWDLIERP